MTVLKILTFPDPRLKIKARSVGKVDGDLYRLMEDMIETMRAFKGIGLAAPQVNVFVRVIVVEIPQAGQLMPLKLINPEIVWCSEDTSTIREDCLSVPQRFADVVRPQKIRYRLMDENEYLVEQEAEGLLSHVIQHEIDHLNGILFIDHLSSLKRDILLHKRIKKA